MRILIISDYFAPDNEIAAVRVTKIGKYLSLAGYNVDVLRRGKSGRKEDILLKNDLQYFDNVFNNYNSGVYNILYKYFFSKSNNGNNKYVSNWNQLKNIIEKYKILKVIKDILVHLLLELIEINYYSMAISKNDIYYGRYNFIFSSFGPLSSHLIGTYIKKKYKNIKWIADFRDPMNSFWVPDIFKYYINFLEREVQKNADIVTLVSSGCCSFFSSKTYIIPNGFDDNDIYKQYNIIQLPSKKYIYTYTGHLYDGKMNFNTFFKIIKELIADEIISYKDIEINYLGKDSDVFLKQARLFLPENIIKNHGYVSREESIKFQSESNALLLASWNNNKEQGNITGKVYEYLMARKPILCFISGNLADSELKNIIKNTETGCCYEEANSQIDYNIMKKYIMNHLLYWKNGENTNYSPKDNYIEQYNFKTIVKKLVTLF